jgi:hypothetical protein
MGWLRNLAVATVDTNVIGTSRPADSGMARFKVVGLREDEGNLMVNLNNFEAHGVLSRRSRKRTAPNTIFGGIGCGRGALVRTGLSMAVVLSSECFLSFRTGERCYRIVFDVGVCGGCFIPMQPCHSFSLFLVALGYAVVLKYAWRCAHVHCNKIGLAELAEAKETFLDNVDVAAAFFTVLVLVLFLLGLAVS